MSPRLKFLICLSTFTVALRLLPYVLKSYDIQVDPRVIFYPWNFLPLTAVCLFSGAYVNDRRWSIGLPLLAVFISDLGIGLITGQLSWGFPSDRWSAYLCYPVMVLMGQGLNRRAWPLRAVSAVGRGMLAEGLFFAVTNFAYFLTQTDFPHTAAGLLACYVAAIPFVKTSLISTAFYSTVLFSPLALHAAGEESSSTSPALQPAVS